MYTYCVYVACWRIFTLAGRKTDIFRMQNASASSGQRWPAENSRFIINPFILGSFKSFSTTDLFFLSFIFSSTTKDSAPRLLFTLPSPIPPHLPPLPSSSGCQGNASKRVLQGTICHFLIVDFLALFDLVPLIFASFWVGSTQVSL